MAEEQKEQKTRKRERKDGTPDKPSIARPRGSKSASLTANLNSSNEDVSRIIMESYRFFERKIVKTDEECAERLNEYFQDCAEHGRIPTVEDMSLALGTTRKTVWEWEQGLMGAERSNMIRKAKEILAGIDAKLVSEGRIPQVTYIFRAKNFFGMKDQQDVIITPNNPLGEAEDPKQLEQKYLDAAYSAPQLEKKDIIDITTNSAIRLAEEVELD